MLRASMLVAVALTFLSVARAADLDGVAMPEVQSADGKQLRLNGIGLRTYSIFNIHIYVAGLYLENPSDNADTILHSPENKLLDLRFVHDVSAEEARRAWQDGFENNCKPPCYLDPNKVRQFLGEVPPMHKGDRATLLFTSSGVEVTNNGRLVGHIPDPHFADIILATFIGPVPPTPRLKRELLGSRN
jgi:hypothetical protein